MFKGATVRDGKTARWAAYCHSPRLANEEAWLVHVNLGLPTTELKSSHVIAVCKRTGRILYEGSAHDEG